LTKVPYNVFIHGCHSQTCLRVFSEEVNEKGGGDLRYGRSRPGGERSEPQ